MSDNDSVSATLRPSVGVDSPPLRVALSGAAGNMGKALIRAIVNAPDAQLVAALGNRHGIGEDSGLWAGIQATDVPITTTWAQAQADVLIDFSTPSALMERLAECTAAQTTMVICMTGLGDEHFAAIGEAAQKLPLIYAANVSIGANLLHQLSEHVGRYLRAAEVVDGIEVDIVEEHSRTKRDLPSGTALQLGNSISEVLYDRPLMESDLKPAAGSRQPRTVAIHSIRRQAVNCRHQVMFAWGDEEIALQHEADNRRVFADGALQAARWLLDSPAGQYTMQQVLGLGASVEVPAVDRV